MSQSSKITPYPKGVRVVTTEAGDGKTYPKAGQTVHMHYRGTFHGGSKHGQEFDSSYKRNKPFVTKIGVGKVIKGWDEGVVQMSIGEKATLEISYDYGYGVDGYPNVIPGKQDLRFDVQLLKIT